MGMDVYGKNPKQNKSIKDFPVYYKYKDMNWKKKEKAFAENEDIQNKYYSESDEYDNVNPGRYFRNNCWRWRPLWDYCHYIAPELIDEKLWSSGHHNDGAGLNSTKAKKLGEKLLKEVHSGNTMIYEADYKEYLENLDSDDFTKHYPFDTENVERFANFCIQSGGFEIC